MKFASCVAAAVILGAASAAARPTEALKWHDVSASADHDVSPLELPGLDLDESDKLRRSVDSGNGNGNGVST